MFTETVCGQALTPYRLLWWVHLGGLRKRGREVTKDARRGRGKELKAGTSRAQCVVRSVCKPSLVFDGTASVMVEGEEQSKITIVKRTEIKERRKE